MTNRGDVVIVRFPYAGGSGFKVRPAVFVQCDRLNRQIQNTIVAMITGNTRLAGTEPTQFLINPADADGAMSGLSFPSAVKCENLANIPKSDIIDTIGHLTDGLKARLQECLKAALEIPCEPPAQRNDRRVFTRAPPRTRFKAGLGSFVMPVCTPPFDSW